MSSSPSATARRAEASRTGRAGAEPVGPGVPVREAQGARQTGQFQPGGRALGFGDRTARLEEPYGPLQHPGPGELHLGGPVALLQPSAKEGDEMAGDLVLPVLATGDEPQGGEVGEGGGRRGDRAAGQGGGGVGVGPAERGQGEESQYPGGGRGQRLVGEEEGPGERVTAQPAELLREVGDRGLGAGGEPAPGEDDRARHAPALLDEALGGLRVDGDADGTGEGGEQLDGRLGVESAEGAGPYVGDAGERPARHPDHQGVGVVGDQRVGLLGVDGVVEDQDGPAPGEGVADQLGQLVLAGCRAARPRRARPGVPGRRGRWARGRHRAR